MKGKYETIHRTMNLVILALFVSAKISIKNYKNLKNKNLIRLRKRRKIKYDLTLNLFFLIKKKAFNIYVVFFFMVFFSSASKQFFSYFNYYQLRMVFFV